MNPVPEITKGLFAHKHRVKTSEVLQTSEVWLALPNGDARLQKVVSVLRPWDGIPVYHATMIVNS